jgi:putative sterol carrier protein
MATKNECEAALRNLAQRLDDVDESLKKRHAPDRTVSCSISDLKAAFSGRLTCGALKDLVDRPNEDAQVRLTVSSDDLVAVTSGELPFATAWADGRVKIEASMLDMLKLRSLALTRQLDA